jgi:hypothetical protein
MMVVTMDDRATTAMPAKNAEFAVHDVREVRERCACDGENGARRERV